MNRYARTLASVGAAIGLALGSATVLGAGTAQAAEPPAGAGAHLSATADNLGCKVTFTMLNYTNSHNWMTMDYWFAQEDQAWAPPNAPLVSTGPVPPAPLPAPWRYINGAKRPVARYTPPSPSDSPGSLRGALPASFPAAQRYQAPYTNFNPSALTTPFKTTVTFDLRTVSPPPPPVPADGKYTLRYRIYLGPQTQVYGYWTPKSVTVGGCNNHGPAFGSSGLEFGSSF